MCQKLIWDGQALTLSEPSARVLDVWADGYSAVPDVAVGDEVAVHWGRLCGRLQPRAGSRARRQHRPPTAGDRPTVGPRLCCQTERRGPVRSATCCPPRPRCLGFRARSTGLQLADCVGDPDQVDRVAVVLVDGLGWHLLPELAGDAPLLASVLAGGAGRLSQLACTFPSTTPTSLVSLGTGAQPGEHGILGFTLNIPGTDRVLNHIRWRDDPPHSRMAAAAHLVRAAAAGRRQCARRAAGVVHGQRAHRRCISRRAIPPDAPDEDYAQRVADELRAAPGLVYGYTADLDTAAHVFGIGSPQWHEAAASVDALLTRLVETLPGTRRYW